MSMMTEPLWVIELCDTDYTISHIIKLDIELIDLYYEIYSIFNNLTEVRKFDESYPIKSINDEDVTYLKMLGIHIMMIHTDKLKNLFQTEILYIDEKYIVRNQYLPLRR